MSISASSASDVPGTARLPVGSAPPPEFEDVITWAAWLYYVDELTQSDVAIDASDTRFRS